MSLRSVGEGGGRVTVLFHFSFPLFCSRFPFFIRTLNARSIFAFDAIPDSSTGRNLASLYTQQYEGRLCKRITMKYHDRYSRLVRARIHHVDIKMTLPTTTTRFR